MGGPGAALVAELPAAPAAIQFYERSSFDRRQSGANEIMVGIGHMNYLVANAIAIALCSLVNFLVSNEYVFDER